MQQRRMQRTAHQSRAAHLRAATKIGEMKESVLAMARGSSDTDQ